MKQTGRYFNLYFLFLLICSLFSFHVPVFVMSLSSFGSISTNSPDNIPTKSSRDNPYSVSFPSMPHTQNFVSDIFNLVISTQNHKGRHRMSTSSPKSQQQALLLTDSSFLSSFCRSS